MYGSKGQILQDELRYKLYVKKIGKQPLQAQLNTEIYLPPTNKEREIL